VKNRSVPFNYRSRLTIVQLKESSLSRFYPKYMPICLELIEYGYIGLCHRHRRMNLFTSLKPNANPWICEYVFIPSTLFRGVDIHIFVDHNKTNVNRVRIIRLRFQDNYTPIYWDRIRGISSPRRAPPGIIDRGPSHAASKQHTDKIKSLVFIVTTSSEFDLTLYYISLTLNQILSLLYSRHAKQVL
jgi:hypothetical protein